MKTIRKFTIWLITLALLCSMGGSLSPRARAAMEPEVTAGAAMLVEINSGRVLFSRNQYARMYPASLTKIMTGLLAVEAVERGDVKLSELVVITPEILEGLGDDYKSAYLLDTEEIPFEQLLYCAIMESDCDACNAIAIKVSGSLSAFVRRMNQRALELGCTATNFTNAHGLHEDEHYSTAADLYLIAAEAYSHTVFTRVAGAVTHTVPATNLSGARRLQTGNLLRSEESSYYNANVTCGNVGYTDEAGYCIAAAANNEELSCLAIVMNADSVQNENGTNTVRSLSEASELFSWAFSSFGYREVLSVSDLIAEIPVKMGDGADSVLLHPTTAIVALLDKSISRDDFQYNVVLYPEERGEELVAPVEAGEILGEVTVTQGGVTYGTVFLAASSSISLLHIEYIRSQVRDVLQLKWIRTLGTIVIVILAAYVLYVILYTVFRLRNRRRAKARARERLLKVRERERERVSAVAERERQQLFHVPDPGTPVRDGGETPVPVEQPKPLEPVEEEPLPKPPEPLLPETPDVEAPPEEELISGDDQRDPGDITE